jgi:type IV pilus assembly protein PilX
MTGRFEIGAGLPRKQQGISLVMALIFLTILMLLGTSATLNTNLQERMAGNTRNRDLAFQAAEAALKDAETTLTAWRTSPFDGSAGLVNGNPIPAHTNDATYWGSSVNLDSLVDANYANWSSYRSPTQNLGQVAEQPRYIVEKLPDVGTTEYYRVTARGVGGDSNAVVILQALYTYTPP